MVDDFHVISSTIDTSLIREEFEKYSFLKEGLKKFPKSYLHNLVDYRLKAPSSSLFRKNTSADTLLSEAWLASAYKLSELYLKVNEVKKYKEITIQDLSVLKSYSVINDFNAVDRYLASIGVVLVYEPSIDGLKTDGAVFLAKNGCPVIAMSLRFPRVDYYWFTLFHELAHIDLHFDHLETPIVDQFEGELIGDMEIQADRWASNALIPLSSWRSADFRFTLKDTDLLSFARKIGISPAIVAGRYRNETKSFAMFSDIVNSYNVREVIFGDQ